MTKTWHQYSKATNCIVSAKKITKLDRKIKPRGNVTNFKLHGSIKFGVDCLQFRPELFLICLDGIAVFPVQLLSDQHLQQQQTQHCNTSNNTASPLVWRLTNTYSSNRHSTVTLVTTQHPLLCDFRIQGLWRNFSRTYPGQLCTFWKTLQCTASLHAAKFT